MVKNCFTSICQTPEFFMFTGPNGVFYIAEGKDGKAPTIEDSRPICCRYQPVKGFFGRYPLTEELDGWFTPNGYLMPTEIFKQDIAGLPQEAQDCLWERFKEVLEDLDDFYAEKPE